MDLSALILDPEGRSNTISISQGQVRRIKTGLIYGGIESEGNEEGPWFATVCSRSGLAAESVFVANSPGIIDPEYRGEIEVLLVNVGYQPKYIRNGDRIAQLVVTHALRPLIVETNKLSQTDRGDKGFGSTGR